MKRSFWLILICLAFVIPPYQSSTLNRPEFHRKPLLRRKRDFWSQLWGSLNSGQGKVVTNNNELSIGPSANGKDLGIGFGKNVGILQGTGFDTGFSDGTVINAGAGNPGVNTGFGVNALGVPVFNYGNGGNVDLQQGRVFFGTDIGAGKILPGLFQQGTSLNFGGVLSGIQQMLGGTKDTAANSRIWNLNGSG